MSARDSNVICAGEFHAVIENLINEPVDRILQGTNPNLIQTDDD